MVAFLLIPQIDILWILQTPKRPRGNHFSFSDLLCVVLAWVRLNLLNIQSRFATLHNLHGACSRATAIAFEELIFGCSWEIAARSCRITAPAGDQNLKVFRRTKSFLALPPVLRLWVLCPHCDSQDAVSAAIAPDVHAHRGDLCRLSQRQPNFLPHFARTRMIKSRVLVAAVGVSVTPTLYVGLQVDAVRDEFGYQKMLRSVPQKRQNHKS